MTTRRNHRQPANRTVRNRAKLQRLRDQVKRSTLQMVERLRSMMDWWTRTFRVPFVATWLASLWIALMALLGLRRSGAASRLGLRRGDIRKSIRRANIRQFLHEPLKHEPLEKRQLLASDLYVDVIGNFVETSDVGGTANVVEDNDIVRWTGPNATDDGGFGDDVAPLTFGTTAFSDLQTAINNATAGDTIYVAEGIYGNIVIDKPLTLLSVAGAAGTIINGPNVNQGSAIRVLQGVQNVVIGGAGQGFTVNAGLLDLSAVYFVGDNDGSELNSSVVNGGQKHAVLMGGGQDNVVVSDNELNGDGPQAVVYILGVASSQPASTNVDIVNNTITGGAGAGLLLGVESSDGEVTGNSFEGMASYAQIEAWGAGTTISGNDFDATGTPFIDGVGTNYDPADIVANNNFASSPIYIEGGAFFSTIQAAINAATAGDTIVIPDGNYLGNLTVNKSLTLKGANAGVSATDPARGAETEIEGFVMVTSAATDVVFDGIHFIAPTSAGGVNIRIESTDSTLTNSIITSKAPAGGFAYTGFVSYAPNRNSVVITDNCFEGILNLVGAPNAIIIGGAVTATISGNKIDNTGGGGSIGLFGNFTTLTVEGNDINGGGEGLFHFGGTIDTFNFTNNEITNPKKNGFFIAGGTTISGGTFSGNTITGAVAPFADINITPGNTIDPLFLSAVSVFNAPNGQDNSISVNNVEGGLLEIDINGATTLVPIALFGSNPLVINGGDQDDTITMDIQAIPAGGITVYGQDPTISPGDSLVLTNSGANPNSIVHAFTNASDGTVTIDGTKVISYTGLEPIVDNLVTLNRTFDYSAANVDAITLTASVVSGSTHKIDSPFAEEVDFVLPTSTLTIIGAAGDSLSISTAVSSGVTVTDIPTVTLSADIGGTVTGNATTVNVNAGAQIQDGIDLAASDAKVDVGAGTFTGGVVVAKPLTIEGAGSTTIINGSTVPAGDTNAAVLIPSTTTGSVEISNLVIELSAAHGIRALNTSNLNLTIDGVTSKSNILSGIRVSGGSNNTLTLTNSVVSGNRQTGVRVANSEASIDQSEIVNNTHTSGTQYGVERAANASLAISNSEISGNRTGGLLVGGGGAQSVLLTNNDFSGQTLGSKIVNNRAQVVNASRNYWGTVDPAMVVITGTSSALVDYSPMLGSVPALNASQYSAVYVHSLGAQSGATGRIPEGAALVAANGDLNVVSGNYTPAAGEPVSVPTTVSLLPGSSPGIVSAGSLNLANNSILVVDIDGNDNSGLTAQFDQLFITGSVAIGSNVALSINFGYLPAPGDSWLLVDNDLAGDAVSGMFTAGTSFIGTGPGGASIPLTLNYAGGDGNDIVLSVTSFSTLYAASTQVGGLARAFTITSDNGAPGFSAGDIVTFTPVGAAPVTGLIYGFNAFPSHDAAIEASVSGVVINSAGWVVNEDDLVGVNISMLGGTGLDGANYDDTTSVAAIPGFQGQLFVNIDETVTYIALPPANFDGHVSFNYQVEGSMSPAVITGTVYVDVLPVNDAPVLAAIEGSSLSYIEDNPTEDHLLQVTNAITVSDIDDTNIESATVSITANYEAGDTLQVVGALPGGVSQSYAAGVLTITGSASKADYQSMLRAVRFSTTNEKPTSNTRTVSFVINDGDLDSNVLTRNIAVTEVNDTPVAVNDTNSVSEDGSVTTQVLSNDTDTDDSFGAGEFEIVSVGTATASDMRLIPPAAVTWLANGQITFNAAGLFDDLDVGDTRTVTIPYTMQDNSGASSSAQLVITVNGVNDAPTAVGDVGATNEDTSVTVNVLTNDTDPDDGLAQFSLASLGTPVASDSTNVSSGVSFLPNGNVTFNPAGLLDHLDTGDTITVTIPYTMQDDNGATSSANLVITVTGINDPVVAVDDSVTTNEDTPVSGNVLTNDTDPDDTPLVIGNTAPSFGAVVMAPNGVFTYTPNSNFNGSDSFTYFVTDGEMTTSAVVYITVNPVNDQPTFDNPANISVLEDSAPVVNAPFITNITPGPIDESGQTVTFSVTTTNPSLFASGPTINAAGQISYTLASNANGSAVVTVTATDSGTPAASQSKNFNFVVTPVNDQPSVTTPSSLTVNEDDTETPVTVPGFATPSPGGAADEASQTFTYQIVGNTNPGLFLVQPSISPTGALSYTLKKDEFGSATISLQVQDSGGVANGGVNTSTTVSFNFVVNPVNDAPIAQDDLFDWFMEDQGPFSIDVIGNLGGGADVPGPSNENTQTLKIVSFTLLSPIPPGVLGNFAINPSETTFDFTPPPNFNGTFSVEYQVRDNGSPNLDSNIATLTVTVNPVNDAPVISTSNPALLSGSVTEDSATNLVITKTVPFTDVDLPDAHTVSVSFVSAGPSLGVTIPGASSSAFATALSAAISNVSTGDGAGAIDWTFTLASSLVDFLAAGETVTLTYNVTVTDNNTSGTPATLSDTEQVVITLTGVNDVPAINGATNLVQGTIGEDAATPNLVVTKTVPFTDKDLTNTHTVGVGSPTITPSGAFSIPGATSSALATALSATISNPATGDGAGTIDWTFTLSSSLAQFLADGESVQVVYPVTITDSSSATSAVKNVTVTVTGANDAPVIDTSNVALLSGTVAEDSASPNLVISKVVPFGDVDLTDAHTVSATYVSVTTTPGSLAIPGATLTAIQAALAATVSNPSTGDGSGQITWTFTLDNSLLNFLNNGQQIQATYNLKVTDDSGVVLSNADTEQVVITLNGNNDAPVATDISFQVGEGQTFIFDLAPFVEDAESADNLLTYNFISITGQPPGSAWSTPPGSSVWSFTAPPSPSITSGIQIVYSVTDPGMLTSTIKTILIDIVDINDSPTANPDIANTTENAAITVNVLANDTDPDPSDTPANFILQSLGTITFSGVPSLTGATIQIVGNQISFNPGTAFDILDAGDTATVTIPYTMTDDEGLPSSSQLVITVTGTNDIPVAVADTATTDENTPVTVNVLANDTDADDQDVPATFNLNSLGTVTSSGVTSLTGSTISISGNQILFNPGTAFDELDPGDVATVTIPYTMQDSSGATSTVNLVITVNGLNDGPKAIDDAPYSTGENTDLTVNVLANDVIIDLGDLAANFSLTAVSIQSVTPSSPSIPLGIASVSISGNQVLFQPGTAFDALDTGESAIVVIQYTVSDPDSLTDTGLLTITVNGVNDAPVALAETYATTEDTTLVVNAANGVLANDTDVDDKYGVKNTLQVNLPIVTPPTKGSVIMAANGSFNYTPFPNQNGQDTFVYQARDNEGLLSAPVTVTINIAPVNDPPVANPDTAATNQNTALAGSTAVNVIANDTDPENDALTVTAATIVSTTGLSGSPASAGAVSVVGNKVEFTPGAAFLELDLGDTATVTISYTIQDPSMATATGQLVITVSGLNDNPVANADTATTNEDAPSITVNVVANDTDPDLNNASLTVSAPTISSVTAPVSIVNPGSVLVIGNQVQFVLSPDYQKLGATESATVTIAYTITDQHGATSTANLVVTVNGVNDNPTTAAGAPRSILEEQPIVGDTGITASDTDTNDTLSFEIVSAPANAQSFSLNSANGSFNYTPAANFNGTDGFVYRVFDGTGYSAPQAVVINITAVNDAPIVTTLGNQSVNENAGPQTVPGFLTFTSGPANESGQTVSLHSVTTVASPNDLFSFAPAITGGTLTYTPATGKFGTATVTVVVKDNGGTANGGVDTTTVSFLITVVDVPDAPVANNDSYTINEDEALNANGVGPNPQGLIANDTDADFDNLAVHEVNGSTANVNTPITITGGTLTVSSNGTFTFAPLANWNGTTSFTYKVIDNSTSTLVSNAATVQITVSAVNDAPVLVLTQPGGTLVEGQQSALLSSLISFSDVDAGAGNVKLTLSTTAGMAKFVQMAGALPSGVSTTPGAGPFANNLEITGPIAGVLGSLSLFKIEVLDIDPGALATATLPVNVLISDLGNSPAPPQTASGTLSFTVADAAPTIVVSGPASVTEGTLYTLNLGPVNDAAGIANDLLVAGVIYWGDGTTTTLLPAQLAALNVPMGTTTVTHLYDDESAMTDNVIRVSLFSAGKNDEVNVALPKEYENAGSTPIAVTGVAPSANVAHTGPYSEGSAAGLITVFNVVDPSSVDFALLEYSIDFGDDGFTLGDIVDQLVPGVNFNVNIPANVLRDNPNTPIRVTLQDKDGLSNSYLLNVPVNNVAPTLASASASATTATTPVTISGSFSDPGVVDNPWTVQVDFGSGWVNAGTLGAQGAFSVSAAHGKAVAGNYVANVRIVDKDGGTSNSLPVNYAIALMVEGVVINSGTVQRSRLTTVAVDLNGVVLSGQESLFELRNRNTNTLVPLANMVFNYDYISNPGKTRVTITFTGAGTNVESGSLVDGNYDITVKGTLSTSASQTLGSDYVFGNQASHKFYRLFGDLNADRKVTSAELNAMLFAFSTSTLNPLLDFNNDGSMSSTDLNQMLARFRAYGVVAFQFM